METNNSESLVVETSKAKNPDYFKEAVLLIGAFLFIFLAYCIFVPLNKVSNTPDGAVAKVFGSICIVGTLIYFGLMVFFKKMTFERKIFTIILLSFFIHLTYILYTQGTTRQYDTWSSNDDGHYAYALSFFFTGKLPTTNITADTIYQFYHPPLNAFIQGTFMHVFQTLCFSSSLTDTTENLYSACQILSCFYMFVTVIVAIKCILLSKLSDSSKVVSCIFVALFPRLTQMSGQLNNDALSIMFSVLSIYWFCKWYFVKKNWLNICMTGLFIGLALMSKMSAASICLGTAVAFIIELVKSIRKKEGSLKVSKLILQYVVFLVICAPLGLWFQVYTHVVYGLPYNFVFSRLNSGLFTGTRNWVLTNMPGSISYYDSNNSGSIYTDVFVNFCARFLMPFLPTDFSHGFYCSAFNDYNILTYVLKCSIFGEFSYWNGEGAGVLSLISLYVLYFSFIVFLIYALVKKSKLGKEGAFALYLTAGMVVMFLYLQIKMPYGCSMDFRYIVPIILPLGYLLGKGNDILIENSKTSGFAFGLKIVASVAFIIFIGSSYLFYLEAI